MKLFRWLSPLLASLLALAACTPAATPLPVPTSAAGVLPDLGGQTITVAVENAYLPFNYVRLDNGKAEGWDYDALAEICKRLNCKPTFQEIAWDNMIAGVAQGQFNMAADGITITADRAKAVDFSDGYIAINQRIMVKKGETRITKIDDPERHHQLRRSREIGDRQTRGRLRHLRRCGSSADLRRRGRRGH
jgi:polar amino acid transport system substrate-binding protein